MRTTIVHWIAALTLMLGGAGPGLAQDKPGPALVAELCTKCHGLDELVGMAQDREGWADTVYSMIARGAPIYPEEIDVIIDYLSNAYPPESR